MYSANVIEGENRILLQCNYAGDRFVKFSAVYDTGAQYTCVTAPSLSMKLTEKEFNGAETMSAGGLIDSENISAKYYKMHINNFYLGNIHLTGVDVWVTFDEKITDSVVGLDVLRRVTRLGIENSNTELFFKDTEEFIKYIKDNENEILKKKDIFIIEEQNSNAEKSVDTNNTQQKKEETHKKHNYTTEDLKANYIHKLVTDELDK